MLVFLAWIVPVAVTTIVVTFVPKFAERYLITTIVPLVISLTLVLVALLWRVPRFGRAAYVTVMAIAILLSLGQTATAAMRGELAEGDDPRALASFLKERTGPEDVLLLIENTPYIFQYYDPGPARVVGLHVGTDYAGAAEALNQMLAQRPRHVWLILWHQTWADPGDFAATELMRRGRTITVTESFASYRVWGFEMLDYSPIVSQPEPQFALAANFGEVASLAGYDLIEHDPGVLHVITYWRRLRDVSHYYLATVALEDTLGYRYVSASQPLATWDYPIGSWPRDALVRVRIDMNLPPDLPAQTYRVGLWLWETNNQAYLPVTGVTGLNDADHVQLADLPLTKAQVGGAPLVIPHAAEHAFASGLRLIGYDLNRTELLPGDLVVLALWWQKTTWEEASKNVGEDRVKLRLLNASGDTVYAAERTVSESYPPEAWSPGEINRVAYVLPLPVALNGGAYMLEAGIADAWVELAPLHIALAGRQFELPPDVEPFDAQFGSLAHLAAYRLEPGALKPGQALTVTLYWEAKESTRDSYHVTAQLLVDGEKVAQHDGIPGAGVRPTTSWQPGEVVADPHPILIPTALPAGRYEILIAMYRGDERVPTGPDTNFVLLPLPK
jgi:hypothetical protein